MGCFLINDSLVVGRFKKDMTYKEFIGEQFNYIMTHGRLDAGFWARADIVDYQRQQRPRRMSGGELRRLVNDGPSIGRLTYGND